MMMQYDGLAVAVARRAPSGGLILLGTGFIVAPDKVATPAHVVGPQESDLFVCFRDRRTFEYQDLTSTQVAMIPVSFHAFDPLSDICILKTRVAQFFGPPTLGTPDGLALGHNCTLMGFPHAPDQRLVYTVQSAQVGAKVLLPVGGIAKKHLVLNVVTRPGQSGSPVVLPGGQSVVAMLVGGYKPPGFGTLMIGNVDPAVIHQTSHAISAEYIKEMI